MKKSIESFHGIVARTAFVILLTIAACAVPANAATTPATPFNQAFNLAHQGTCTIESLDTTDPLFHQLEKKQYPGPPGGLTANSLIWTGFLRQGGRVVTVNLGQKETLTQVSIQFFENTQQSILFPSSVRVDVSMNGYDWHQAGIMHSSYPPFMAGKLYDTYVQNIDKVQAQYVRLEFPVDVWVLARNLRIMGSPWITPSLVQLPYDANFNNYAGFLQNTSPAAAGVHNMLLVYSGAYGTEGTWTTKQFQPMVSFISPSGQVEGRMFDSFLFLPYGTLLGTEGGWAHYLQNLFAPGQQLAALNQTVAQAAPKLNSFGLQANTVNVVLAIPYPNSRVTSWGNIPGTSQNLTFNSANVGTYQAYNNRVAAMYWYVRALMNAWKQANFQHLKLVGLYWDAEQVTYSIPNETKLVQQASKLTHSYGLKLFWIPLYDASGITSWQQLGFDSVILQSNYFETPSLPISRVTAAADTALRFGTGMEVEIGPQVFTSPAEQARYYNQLVAEFLAGAEDGVVHAYYDGSQVLTQLAYSTNPALRSLYQDTYDFLLGQFSQRNYQAP